MYSLLPFPPNEDADSFRAIIQGSTSQGKLKTKHSSSSTLEPSLTGTQLEAIAETTKALRLHSRAWPSLATESPWPSVFRGRSTDFSKFLASHTTTISRQN